MENLLSLMVKNIHDSLRTVKELSVVEIFTKNGLTWSIFELEKCFSLNGSEFC